MAQNNTAGHISDTTQQYLEIVDITNDMVILRDGSTAIVLEVNAINFGLLSEPEQDAIIYAYAALINSLSFALQIVISSRPKDVTNYLEYVDEQYQKAPSDMRRQQIALYRQFVANMITEQNVLEKDFYVVLPLSALELGVAGAASPVGTIIPNNKPVQFDKYAVIERSLNILVPRRDHMISQFSRIGLRAKQLNTKDLIRLFYTLYNQEASEGIRVVDTKDYTSALIQPQGIQAPSFESNLPPQETPIAAALGTPQMVSSPPTGVPQEPSLPPQPEIITPLPPQPPLDTLTAITPETAVPTESIASAPPMTAESLSGANPSAVPQETISFTQPR